MMMAMINRDSLTIPPIVPPNAISAMLRVGSSIMMINVVNCWFFASQLMTIVLTESDIKKGPLIATEIPIRIDPNILNTHDNGA